MAATANTKEMMLNRCFIVDGKFNAHLQVNQMLQ